MVFTVNNMDVTWVNFYGNPLPNLTPNMDRLARQGMRFEYAHVNADLPAVPPVDDDRPAAESSRTSINQL